jgi:hypothetical protein
MCSKGAPPTPNATSTTGSTSGQATATPNPVVGGYYENFLANATNLAARPFNPATMGSVAPLTGRQETAISNAYQGGLDAGNFDPAQIQEIMSPYIGNVVNTTQGWFNNQNAIQGNQLIGQAIRSGNAFGGDRAGVAQAELAGQQQVAQAPVIAGLYQSGYGQALDEYNKLKQFGMLGAEQAIKASSIEQQQAQRERDMAQQNAMMETAYPFQQANWYGSILGGIGPLMGGSTTTATNTVATPPQADPLTTGLGLASSAVGIANVVAPGVTSAARGLFGMQRGGSVDKEFDDSDMKSLSDSLSESGDGKKTKEAETEYVTGDPGKGVPNILGQLKLERPRNVFPQAQTTQPLAAQKPDPKSGIGGTISALSGLAGTIFGGPVGGAVGAGAGKLASNLLDLERGGLVRGYQEGGDIEDEREDDDTDEEGTEDSASNLFSGTFGQGMRPLVPPAAMKPDPSRPIISGPPEAAGIVPLPQPRPAEERPGGIGSDIIVSPPEDPDPEPPPGATTTRGQLERVGGGGGRGGTRTIPGLGRPPMTFAQRFATDPFLRAGIAMLQNRSPYLAHGIGQGLAGATAAMAERGRYEMLDSKPQLIPGTDTAQYRVGNKIIDTGVPIRGRGQKELTPNQQRQRDLQERRLNLEEERFKRQQEEGGTKGRSTSVRADADRNNWIQREAKRALGTQSATPENLDASYRWAIKQWNQLNPNSLIPEPPAPTVAETPSGAVDNRRWWEKKNFGLWGTDTPAQAAPAQAAPEATPAQTAPAEKQPAPTTETPQMVPAELQLIQPRPTETPQAPTPTPTPVKPAPVPGGGVMQALKEGRTTRDKVMDQARRAIAAGKDRLEIFKRLREAGIDPSELTPTPVPQSR